MRPADLARLIGSLSFKVRLMENVRATSRPALWLMFSIILVALNLRPSMAAVGPLRSAIRGDIALSFSLASLLTMLASDDDGAGDVL